MTKQKELIPDILPGDPPMAKPLHVVSLEASNMMRLTAVRIVPGKGPLVLISGDNGAGKSSVLNCIDIGARGADALPDQPIRQGQTSAETKMDIGDFIITTKINASGGRYRTIKAKDGTVPKSPQALLESFYSKAAFDPMAFLSWKRPQQVAELRRLAGIDTTTIDTLRASHADERKILGGQIDGMKSSLAMTPDPGVPADEAKVDPATVDTEIQAANKALREWNVQAYAVDQKKGHIGNAQEQVRFAQRDVDELKAKLKSAESHLRASREKEAELSSELVTLEKALPTKPEVDTAALQTKRSAIVDRNAKIDKAIDRAAQAKKLATEEARWEKINQTIKDLDAKRERLISSAKLPVDGLSFNDSGVTFKGLPFEQASSAEKIRVSVAIAMANSPRLKVALVREGSLLDDNSLKLLAEAAEAQGAQVWVEVAGKRAGAIEIVDGEVAETKQDAAVGSAQ